MSDYNVTLIVDDFEVPEEKQEEFLRLAEHFQGVEVTEYKNDIFGMHHIGTGFVFNVMENEDYEGDELLEKGINDLPEFIQYYMAEGEEIILKDIGHLRAAEAYGVSCLITKDKIDTRTLHTPGISEEKEKIKQDILNEIFLQLQEMKFESDWFDHEELERTYYALMFRQSVAMELISSLVDVDKIAGAEACTDAEDVINNGREFY